MCTRRIFRENFQIKISNSTHTQGILISCLNLIRRRLLWNFTVRLSIYIMFANIEEYQRQQTIYAIYRNSQLFLESVEL